MLLTYDDDGPGPVVVLIHGFPLDRTIWAAQRATIGAIYRVIAPDLRGFGKTAAPESGYSIDQMADDVVELLDALQLKQPVAIGGLSMGGYIALSLWARHPERVRALMLMDTRAAADSPEVARNREALARQVEEAGHAEAVVESMLPKFFSPITRQNRAELMSPVQNAMKHASARGVAGALRAMAGRPDRTADLARIHVPTLVLVGEDDVISPVAEMRALAEAIPNARLAVIPRAGHLAPLENPGAANAAILGFLNGLG